MEFPFTTTTRAGTTVTITGHYSSYDRPWVGFIEVDLVDATFQQPLSWLPSGAYVSPEIERSLDITVPI
jgi:hypothetical protein